MDDQKGKKQGISGADQQGDQKQASPKVSRRRFLKAAGASAVGVATAGVVPLTASKAHAAGAWDMEADIVVVGSGAAAGVAAAKALDLGQSVIVLEKAPIWGGTTAKSGGGYWIPNNSLMRKLGLEDPRQDAIRLMARMSYQQMYNADHPRFGMPQLDYDLFAAFYDNAARAVDDLAKIGALQSVLYTDNEGTPNFPDYSAHLPENKAPFGRIMRATNPEGKGGFGFHMVAQLKAYIEEHGGEIFLRHGVTSLVVNDAREVVGVEAQTGNGGTVAVRAYRAVIFGSGGFTHEPEFRQHFLRGPIFGGCAVPTNQGDFIRIGGAIGAGMGNLANAFWLEVGVEQALENISTAAEVWVPPGDSMFYVNKFGKRVVDEKMVYNERTQVHFLWDPDRYEYTNLVLFMIWDQRTHERYAGAYPIPKKDAKAPYVLTANTMDALGDVIDARLAKLSGNVAHLRLDASFKGNLAETKDRFNDFAAKRRDADFHRGEVPASAWFHRGLFAGGTYDPDAPNDMMYPLTDEGPYYAILLGAGTLDTKGGPRIGPNAQILDTHGKPLPGLYGAGNCIASPTGNAYWAGGSTLGPAVAFGFLAAESAANEPIKAASL